MYKQLKSLAYIQRNPFQTTRMPAHKNLLLYLSLSLDRSLAFHPYPYLPLLYFNPNLNPSKLKEARSHAYRFPNLFLISNPSFTLRQAIKARERRSYMSRLCWQTQKKKNYPKKPHSNKTLHAGTVPFRKYQTQSMNLLTLCFTHYSSST